MNGHPGQRYNDRTMVTRALRAGIPAQKLACGISSETVEFPTKTIWNETTLSGFEEFISGLGVGGLDVWRTDIDTTWPIDNTEPWMLAVLDKFIARAGLTKGLSARPYTVTTDKKRPQPKGHSRGIQWAVGTVGQGGDADPAPFLLGSNPHEWGNSSLAVSDITTGILQCCSGLAINLTGHLLEAYPSQTGLRIYDAYVAAGMEVYIDIDPAEGEHERASATVWEPGGPAIGLNCSNPPGAGQHNCVTPADICGAALARIAESVI